MQVDRSYFEVSMAEQDLNGAQVGAGFKKMCGETMTQSVRMDAPMLKAGTFRSDLAGSPEDLGGDGITCRVPAVAGKQPLLRLAPETSPVDAKFLKQLRAEHDIAVLAALALSDMDNHPPAVDVTDLQASRFCTACAGSIHRHQQDAMKRCVGGLHPSRDFVLPEYPRKVTHLLRIGSLGDAPAALQHVDVEET